MPSKKIPSHSSQLYPHQARKRFGQNFLQDAQVIERIIAAIRPRAGQHLVEIGPGRGALTAYLLAATQGKLHVIELDRDLIPLLRTNFFNYPELHIHQADALTFDFTALSGSMTEPIDGQTGETDTSAKHKQRLLRIVGNLPYNISTPLIFHLLQASPCIKDMHFMLQREVVQRLCAGPGSGAYGRLSVMLQYYCEAEHLFDVAPGAFKPQPKVHSAIVRLTPHIEPPVKVKDPAKLELVVKTAFAQRRKTLRNNLKPLISAEQLIQLDIDPGLRAENLSLHNFASISDTLA